MIETWKSVVGYETIYEVSDFGRVRRLKRAKGTRPLLILQPSVKSDGREKVVLSVHSKTKNFHVHCLVALAFLGARPVGMEINHKDGNTRNNALSNLEYCTPKENGEHSRRVLRRNVGESHRNAKLTVEKVHMIRDSKLRASALALALGVSESTVRDVITRRTWKYD